MTKNQKPPDPPPQKNPNKTGNQQQSSLRDWSDQASTALEGKYLERLHRSRSGGDVLTPWLGYCDTSVALSCCFFVFIRVSFNKSEGFSASALNMYGVLMCLLEQKNTKNRICSSLIEANYLDSAPLHVHPVLAPTEKFCNSYFSPPVFNIHRVFGQFSKKSKQMLLLVENTLLP